METILVPDGELQAFQVAQCETQTQALVEDH